MKHLFRVLPLPVLLLLAACSPGPTTDSTPTIVLAANAGGILQFDFSGEGGNTFSRLDNVVTYRIGPSAGSAWATGTVTLKNVASNSVILVVESSASRPYEVRLQGFATSADAGTSEADTTRTVQISPGNQTLELKRFVVRAYDFEKK